MAASVQKIGVREFREHLPEYLLSSSPVAITRHGETLGFYIPSHGRSENNDISALKKVATQLDSLLAAHGISEDELLAEFRELRKSKQPKTKKEKKS